MESSEQKVEHITPDEDELIPYHTIKCTQANCLSVFYNRSHFVLHMQKHHKIAAEEPVGIYGLCRYYCPVGDCRYNQHCNTGKHFKMLKYVRQHYQKMHMERNFPCENCDKSFITKDKLKIHKTTVCGKKFPCLDCVWAYDSKEALLTHGKRKSHNVRCQTPSKNLANKVAIMPLKSTIDRYIKVKQYKPAKQQTQQKQPYDLIAVRPRQDKVKEAHHKNNVHDVHFTNHTNPKAVESHVHQHSNEIMDHKQSGKAAVKNGTVNNALPSTAVPVAVPVAMPAFPHQDLGDISTILRDIETQTEPQQQHLSANNSNYLNPMLSHSSNMYTQTCNDILRELVLADIETQTNWSEAGHLISTATSTNPYINNQFFVSTETQTNFNPTILDVYQNVNVSVANGFGNISQTQYTQTCTDLLQGIEFSTPDELDDVLPPISESSS